MKRRYLILVLAFLMSSIDYCLCAQGQAVRPIVTGISAQAVGRTAVKLSWTMPPDDDGKVFDQILVFCSPVPIKSFDQIESAAPKAVITGYKPRSTAQSKQSGGAASGDAYTWTDEKPPMSEGFYAVVLVTDGKRFPLIIPSVNATVTGVRPRKRSRPGKALTSEGAAYSARPAPVPGASAAASGILGGGKDALSKPGLLPMPDTKGAHSILPQYIFKEDLVEPQTGDGVFLFDILKTSFIKGKYTDAERALTRLLRTNMAHSVTVRSSFYLGECYYFMGEYEKAIREFLSAQASDESGINSYGLSALCGRWIDSSLDLLWSKVTLPSSKASP